MTRKAEQRGEAAQATATDAGSLLSNLQSADTTARIAACRAAANDPSAVVYIPAVANALGDRDFRVGRAASDALVEMSREHEIVSELKQQLHGASAQARWGAAFTLARIRPPEPALLPAAIEAFASQSGDVRWTAAQLVVDMGRLHDDVLPVTLALAAASAESAEPRAASVRRMALFCLRELAPDEPAVVEAVLRCLGESGDSDAAVEMRRTALTCAYALLGTSDELAKASAVLAEHLRNDTDPRCQCLAALALAEWARRNAEAPKGPARDALEEALQHSDDPTLREAAQRALALPHPTREA